MILDIDRSGVERQCLIEVLEAEGVFGVDEGYTNTQLPMYQKKQAYGSNGFSLNLYFYDRDIDYSKGICPVAEELHEHSFLGLEMCIYELPNANVEAIVAAFHEVWSKLNCLA